LDDFGIYRKEVTCLFKGMVVNIAGFVGVDTYNRGGYGLVERVNASRSGKEELHSQTEARRYVTGCHGPSLDTDAANGAPIGL
jgi:hypothetical protein